MNERAKALKKYACKNAPDGKLLVCFYKIKGLNKEGEEPSDTNCLLCVANTMNRTVKSLLAIILDSGVHNISTSKGLQEELKVIVTTENVMDKIGQRVQPNWSDDSDNFADTVERLLEVQKACSHVR